MTALEAQIQPKGKLKYRMRMSQLMLMAMARKSWRQPIMPTTLQSMTAKKPRVRIHETTLENDIRYRGPLSGQHFKMLGWLCIAFSQAAVILRLGGRFDPAFAAGSASWLNILSNIADLSLPFLLIASFSQLLDTEGGYRRQLLVNGAAMAGISGNSKRIAA